MAHVFGLVRCQGHWRDHTNTIAMVSTVSGLSGLDRTSFQKQVATECTPRTGQTVSTQGSLQCAVTTTRCKDASANSATVHCGAGYRLAYNYTRPEYIVCEMQNIVETE